MTRVLRAPGLETSPISVPGPSAWGPVAVAAHDQGYASGLVDGRAQGRRDLSHVADELGAAVIACVAEIDVCRRMLVGRVIEVAELMVATVLRHMPDSATAGLLLRVREALDSLDTGAVELAVHPDLVATVEAAVGALPTSVEVGGDHSLGWGEFRLRTEWANADATWQHYLDAAREAIAVHVATLGDGR